MKLFIAAFNMSSSEQNPEECDATDDHSSNTAGLQIKITIRKIYKIVN